MADDDITKEKIRRALLAGPESITSEATVVEMGSDGEFIVLKQGSNKWTCMPGTENVIGDVPMCADEMGMQWFKDIMARKPKPTNTAPGLIYMLCELFRGVLQILSIRSAPRSRLGRIGCSSGHSTPEKSECLRSCETPEL